ncbi:MAG: chorismate synthase [Oscillospiraceae bacterium]|nr:chorismate synthase [Oscillospiraceae bacterium]
MMEYTLFGESHGGVVGVVLEHVPAGIPVDEGFTAAQLLRRAPRGAAATARHETDEVAYLSGVFGGKTTGMPLVAVLRNGDIRPGDYEALRSLPRPGHADYAAFVRAAGHQDYRGGGHYSGRLTAPLVVAGALALTYLSEKGVAVSAHVVDEENLRARAEEARKKGDSVGGQVACTVTGLPAGIGGPDYRDAVESEIARHVFAIPAVKALGFGSGEALASMEGSRANDPLRTDGERIYTTSNHAGGINGGVTNGMPVTFTVTFRPTPSIALPQDTVDLTTMTNATVTVHGRHDSCVALRAESAVESAAALALCALLPVEDTEIGDLRRRIDAIDSQITALLVERLQTAERIGQYKKDHNLAVQDGSREAEVLRTRGDWAGPYRDAVEQVFRTVMAQAREVQK